MAGLHLTHARSLARSRPAAPTCFFCLGVFGACPAFVALVGAELEIQAMMMIEAQDLHTHNGKVDLLAVKEEAHRMAEQMMSGLLDILGFHRSSRISPAP